MKLEIDSKGMDKIINANEKLYYLFGVRSNAFTSLILILIIQF